MKSVTRRQFLLGSAGVVALPHVLPAHHRPGHQGKPTPTPTPTPTPGQGVYTDSYETTY